MVTIQFLLYTLFWKVRGHMPVIDICYLRRVLKITKQSEAINIYSVAILKAYKFNLPYRYSQEDS